MTRPTTPTPGEHVLVIYASAHGSTAGIAEAIAEQLRRHDLTVDVSAVEDAGALDAFDAVVLGSAIHSGRWLPPAAQFVDDHRTELDARPTWLFSVSSVGDTSSVFGRRVASAMRRFRSEPEQISAWTSTMTILGHRNFAGVVQRQDWGAAGNVFVRLLGGTYGDHRDWDDIARWGDEVADGLARSRRATAQSGDEIVGSPDADRAESEQASIEITTPGGNR